MNQFKLSACVFALGLSLNVAAADNTIDTTGTTGSSDTTRTIRELNTNRELSRPSTSDTVKLRDCSSRSGNDKMLCEKDNQPNNSNAISNDSRNNTLRDDMRSRELNNRELNNRSLNNRNLRNNPLDMQSRDNQSRESYPSDTGSSAYQPNGSNSMNSTTGEMRPNPSSRDNYRNNSSSPSRSM